MNQLTTYNNRILGLLTEFSNYLINRRRRNSCALDICHHKYRNLIKYNFHKMFSESNIFFLNLFNVSLGLIYIFYCSNRMISKKSILLLPISSSILVLTNFLLIGFLPQILGEEYNTYDILINSSISGVIFISVCMAAQLFSDSFSKSLLKKKVHTNNDIIWSYSPTYFLYIFIIIVIFGFIRFVFFSGGINYIGMILLDAGDFYKYNLARLDLGKLLNSLPGSGLAGMSLQYLSPSIISCLFILLMRSKKRKKFFFRIFMFFLIISLILLNFVLSMIFAKKAMLFYIFIFPLIMLIISRQNQKFTFSNSNYITGFDLNGKHNLLLKKNTNNSKTLKNRLKKFFIAITLVLAILMVVNFIYSLSQGGSSDENLLIFIQRIFVVPAQTSSFYYASFPSVFPFRGIENLLGFSGDIDYSDISEAFTGYRFVSNASFLTISYSAGGFFAVILVSFLYSIVTLIHDRFFEKQESVWKNFILIASINGTYAITSAPLDASIINFGYLLPTLIVLLCLKKKQVFLKRV